MPLLTTITVTKLLFCVLEGKSKITILEILVQEEGMDWMR